MAKLLVIIGMASCFIISIANSRAANFHTSSIAARAAYLVEGVGFDGVNIGLSSASDVEAAFGNKFTLLSHNQYSYEMVYKDKGLSFYYCYNDADKRIFLVEAIPNFHGVTGKGLNFPDSTMRDVFHLYGKAPLSPTATEGLSVCEYEGIQFFFKVSEEDKLDENIETLLEKKIEYLDLVPLDTSSNFCDGFEKSESETDAQ